MSNLLPNVPQAHRRPLDVRKRHVIIGHCGHYQQMARGIAGIGLIKSRRARAIWQMAEIAFRLPRVMEAPGIDCCDTSP